jgi:hypothetical protein
MTETLGFLAGLFHVAKTSFLVPHLGDVAVNPDDSIAFFRRDHGQHQGKLPEDRLYRAKLCVCYRKTWPVSSLTSLVT